MGLRVHENVVARRVSDSLANHALSVDRAMRQLSTGRRINSAPDDASGLAIADKMRAQVEGLNQATGNAQDGMHLVQAAESSMGEVHGILQRMRELAVHAATDTLTLSDRSQIRTELGALAEEIDRIGNAAEYNTRKLLDGSLASAGLTLQVGANAGQTFNIRLDTLSAAALGILATQLSVDNPANSSAAIARLDAAIDQVSRSRANAGATVRRLEHAIADLGVMHSAMSGSESRIRDLDMARGATRLATGQILAQSTVAMLTQANAQPQSVLALLR